MNFKPLYKINYNDIGKTNMINDTIIATRNQTIHVISRITEIQHSLNVMMQFLDILAKHQI